MAIELDQILGAIAPGATYQTFRSMEAGANWNGIWFDGWIAGVNNQPAPTYEQIQQVADLLIAAGKNQTFETGMVGLIQIFDTSAFKKVIASIPKNPSIAMLGMVALGSIFLYLHQPSDEGATRARAAWMAFTIFSQSQREVTGISAEDVTQFNETIDELGFPLWLKLA